MTHASTSAAWKPMNALQEGTAGPLLRALVTTFDPPDPEVLIGDYLPAWLGLHNGYAEEGHDRLRFFAELEGALRRMKGKIAIVSSAGEVRPSAHGWLWNYVRRLEVGRTRQAVQHAKLWMFHRAALNADDPETLEVLVSSANLTRAGLRDQIQAGWRCILPLVARGSEARRQSWGILGGFLEALGANVGSADGLVEPWLDLLRRCECPERVVFLASVPGSHAPSTLRRSETSWGAAGLKRLWRGKKTPRIAVMAPTIGKWTEQTIAAWCAAAGSEAERLSIAWLGASHPWSSHWQLDKRSEQALSKTGVTWLQVPGAPDAPWDTALCDEHREADTRWSHAKLYELQDGHQRSLLITSANFSRAAWGDPQPKGGLGISNFELGVVLVGQKGFVGRMPDAEFKRATCDVEYAPYEELPIAWLYAEWDGKLLSIHCRPRKGETMAGPVSVTVARGEAAFDEDAPWKGRGAVRCDLAWPTDKGTPLVVAVRAKSGETRATAVHDRREGDDRMLCGEFDEATLKAAEDALIEERYGYLPVGGGGDQPAGATTSTASGKSPADYSVPAYVDARRRFALIDNWAAALAEAEETAGAWVVDDGRRILARWSETATEPETPIAVRVPARVATEELRKRLEAAR